MDGDIGIGGLNSPTERDTFAALELTFTLNHGIAPVDLQACLTKATSELP